MCIHVLLHHRSLSEAFASAGPRADSALAMAEALVKAEAAKLVEHDSAAYPVASAIAAAVAAGLCTVGDTDESADGGKKKKKKTKKGRAADAAAIAAATGIRESREGGWEGGGGRGGEIQILLADHRTASDGPL